VVLCSSVQSFLIWEFLEGRNPFKSDWLKQFRDNWSEWIKIEPDPICRTWAKTTAKDIPEAWEVLERTDWNLETFSSWKAVGAGSIGFCVLTLQIALWAASWGLRSDPFPVPDGFPAEVFERRGANTLAWAAMTGGDTDTYGAVCGPLVAS